MTTQRIPPYWPRRALELMGFTAPPDRPTLLARYRVAQFERELAELQELDAERRAELAGR